MSRWMFVLIGAIGILFAAPLTATAQLGDFCGGIAGIPCPEGYACVDDPRDDCDPVSGGADCPGICVGRSENDCVGICHALGLSGRSFGECVANCTRCDCPGCIYISRDLEKCALIRWFCIEGYVPFTDECGCGCKLAS